MVRGCLEWQEGGLAEPESLRLATAKYRDEQDRLAGFLAGRCVIGKDEWGTAAELYDSYESWALAAGEEPVKPNTFGRMLAERGFTKDRKTPQRAVRWLGVGLNKRARAEPTF